ncbi:MAG: glycoside hydrolase TIM-barrel-like domain-containing protein [Chloroflexi bacterium]|nr:glycoside hydrolase TIM-barrel-like domain-containing protein [Chloroflexota bacterium]
MDTFASRALGRARTNGRTFLALAGMALLLSSLQDPLPSPRLPTPLAEPKISRVNYSTAPSTANLKHKGVAYASWTKGQYPFTASWEAQTYTGAQAIGKVSVTDNRHYVGSGSLEIDVDLVGDDPANQRRAGETFINLLIHPLQDRPSDCSIGPVDLAGARLSAKVYAPYGSSGDPSSPNTLQLFVRDESMRSFFGIPTFFGENQWNDVTAVVPRSAPGFDPTRVAVVGLRIDSNSSARFAGKIWLDEFDWDSGSIHPKYGFDNVLNSLDRIKGVGANSVSLIVTWYQDTTVTSTIYPDPTKTHTDQEIVDTIREVHSRGMSVLLAPHVDVQTGDWRGAIDPADPNAWFASYARFISHYAQIAQSQGVELFLVGTELARLEDAAHRDNWNAVIDQVRRIYGGQIAYAANWDSYGFVSFWDLLDIAGVDAYFPLSDARDPTVDELASGWTHYVLPGGEAHNWLAEMERWQLKIDKPVIFAEIGYRSRDYAARKPWSTSKGGTYNGNLQARSYLAASRAFQNSPWLQGLFIWNWLPFSDAGGFCDDDFTPQNKPAEVQLASIFAGRLYLPLIFRNATAGW